MPTKSVCMSMTTSAVSAALQRPSNGQAYGFESTGEKVCMAAASTIERELARRAVARPRLAEAEQHGQRQCVGQCREQVIALRIAERLQGRADGAGAAEEQAGEDAAARIPARE